MKEQRLHARGSMTMPTARLHIGSGTKDEKKRRSIVLYTLELSERQVMAGWLLRRFNKLAARKHRQAAAGLSRGVAPAGSLCAATANGNRHPLPAAVNGCAQRQSLVMSMTDEIERRGESSAREGD